MENNYKNIVVLVDGDNAQESKMQSVIEKISTYGRISVKRIYGNWKKSSLKNWEKTIKNSAFRAQQQFDYVAKKNATDMALIVDAMDLLYTGRYDAFVIVSTDSDFTPLNIKLKEMGIFVIGVGSKNASEAFIHSCDDFIYIESLPSKDESANNEAALVDKEASVPSSQHQEACVQTAEKEQDKQQLASAVTTQMTEEELHGLLKMVASEVSYQDDDGFVNVSSAGSYIKRVRPDFDIRQFGFEKLPGFIAAHPQLYQIKRYKGKGKVTIVAYSCH